MDWDEGEELEVGLFKRTTFIPTTNSGHLGN
jgi:hypothetical protein